MIAIQKPGDARVCRYGGAAVFVGGIHVCRLKPVQLNIIVRDNPTGT